MLRAVRGCRPTLGFSFSINGGGCPCFERREPGGQSASHGLTENRDNQPTGISRSAGFRLLLAWLARPWRSKLRGGPLTDFSAHAKPTVHGVAFDLAAKV